MMRIGITGGIGSGKTTVCKILEKLGALVFYADDIAREEMNRNPELKILLSREFGDKIYSTGLLDRKLLAEIVFAEPRLLVKLNEMVHPHVHQRFSDWCLTHKSKPLLFMEAAILFETGSWRKMDKNILIIAPKEERIQRVIQRDNTQRELVLRRMTNQMDEEEKIKLADILIMNPEKELLFPKVLAVWEKLVKDAKFA